MTRKLSRRALLRGMSAGSLAMAGVVLLAACGAPTPTPTPAPAPKPAEAPKPAAPAPAPAAAPTATPAPAAAPKPAEAPKPTPVVAAPKAEPTKVPAPRASVARNRTLIIGFEGGPAQAPENANPYVPGARINQGYHQLMIESLFYLNYESGKAEPWLAEGFEFNRDYTQVDIKLRGGVEWADGRPFTAEDVAFTLNLLKENPSFSYGPEMQKNVKEAKVADIQSPRPSIVRVTLNEPYPRFIFNNFTVHIWGAVRILPKHIWEGQDAMKFTNYDMSKGWPIFTGPYRLVKASSTEFVYDRRDDWWGAKTGFKNLPMPERVVFVEAGTNEKKAAALEANDVDGQPSLQTDTFLELRRKNPNAIGWMEQPPHTWIDPCPGMLGFNCELAPWDDREMRWAVNLAIDKKKLAEATPGGFGIPARYNFPKYPPLEAMLDENADLFQKYNVLEFNPGKAMQIIEGKGYKKGGDGIFAKDGKPLKVDLLVKSGALTGAVVPLLISFFKNVGIDAVPQGLADTQYFDRRNRGDFQIETTHVACGSVVDPFGELNLFHSQWVRPKGEIRSNNVWGYKNPEYDDLVNKVKLTLPGDPGLKPLFRQALEMRLRDLPIVPLTQQLRVVPYTTKYWTNWPTDKTNYIHPPNWWMMFLVIVLNVKPTGG